MDALPKLPDDFPKDLESSFETKYSHQKFLPRKITQEWNQIEAYCKVESPELQQSRRKHIFRYLFTDPETRPSQWIHFNRHLNGRFKGKSKCSALVLLSSAAEAAAVACVLHQLKNAFSECDREKCISDRQCLLCKNFRENELRDRPGSLLKPKFGGYLQWPIPNNDIVSAPEERPTAFDKAREEDFAGTNGACELSLVNAKLVRMHGDGDAAGSRNLVGESEAH